jgi:hypothetical protein
LVAACETTSSNYHLAPNGSDQNLGTKSQPFATLARARDAIRQDKLDGRFPENGITVWIKGGHYSFDEPLELSAQDSGTEQGPIVYRAQPGETVVFDGNLPIDSSAFHLVTESLNRLNLAARTQAYVAAIDDEGLRELLSRSDTKLSFDGTMMQLARFPNTGFAHIETITSAGAVYAHGRTFGDPPTYSMENPIGGSFTLVESPSGNWEAEFQRTQKAELSGYLSYDWYRRDHQIARIEGSTLQLLEYSRYGVESFESLPRRLVVRNLLCELDEPGEWYYDDASNSLYLWPFNPIDASTQLGIWAGPPFALFDEASHVQLQGLTIQGTNSGEGMIVVKGGQHNRIAGCTLRNTTRMAAVFEDGADNGMVGCDLYDVSGHLQLEGGETATLNPAGNYAINCHFTQVQAAGFYGRVIIRGVGNIFRNNLIHNAPGQIMTVGGNDHLIERNEMFNTGIEEGDGGAMYSGQQMWSYGNVYRHNFLHHLMCMPQAHPRGGIYPDDHDAGDTIVENVFYKAAHRAVLLNGGAAQTVARNVFVDGYIGIYNTSAYGESAFASIAKYESGEVKRGDKGDHIWRTQQVVGEEGWNKPPWSTRYPLFTKVMNQEKMRFFPIACRFIDNVFSGNHQNFMFRTGWGDDDLVDVSTIDYIETSGNQDVSPDVFVNAESMDFRFAEPDSWPAIPFGEIGLYVDAHRPVVPDKTAYRMAIKDRFAARPSFDPDARYDPATVNELIYFNTGKLIMDSLEQ